jgi:predicted dehydrogenase
MSQIAHRRSRRSFLATGAAATAGFMIVPRRVLGGQGVTPPSDLVNVAGIGAAGRASANLQALASQNIVALCEVDWTRVDGIIASGRGAGAAAGGRGGGGRGAGAPAGAGGAGAQGGRGAGRGAGRGGRGTGTAAQTDAASNRRLQAEKYAKAARYDDYRVMLETQKDIDAVVISTPDHTHAHAAIMAMQLGKHVYLEKPLTYSVREARLLLKAAEDSNVVTQMGNTGHSNDESRRMVEMLWAGALGAIHEVHVWTNRPIWPQGIARPETKPVPKTLNWDMWLGPAPMVPYNDGIHPFGWRGYAEYGTGAIGDMGAHQIDFVFRALDPGLPARVEARHSAWGGSQSDPRVTYPLASTIYWDFSRGGRPPLRIVWYDGGLVPPTPQELPVALHERMRPGSGGVLYIGEKGKLLTAGRGSEPYFMPERLNEQFANPPQRLHRIQGSSGGHQMNWIRAIKGTEKISCPFDFAVPVCETMLLGMAAMRADVPLEYDGLNMRVTNYDEANQYLDRQKRRPGWEI